MVAVLLQELLPVVCELARDLSWRSCRPLLDLGEDWSGWHITATWVVPDWWRYLRVLEIVRMSMVDVWPTV